MLCKCKWSQLPYTSISPSKCHMVFASFSHLSLCVVYCYFVTGKVACFMLFSAWLNNWQNWKLQPMKQLDSPNVWLSNRWKEPKWALAPPGSEESPNLDPKKDCSGYFSKHHIASRAFTPLSLKRHSQHKARRKNCCLDRELKKPLWLCKSSCTYLRRHFRLISLYIRAFKRMEEIDWWKLILTVNSCDSGCIFKNIKKNNHYML